MKKDKLSISEQHLFKRFTAYNEKNLTVPIKDILKNYKEEIFFTDIFVIMAEDVFTALSITECNKQSYQRILSEAHNIYTKTGLFFPAHEHFRFALSIVWITYCCKYKGQYILNIEKKSHALFSSCINLEYSITAHFFNQFGGPPLAKSKKLERYIIKKYGDSCRDSEHNNNHTLNFQTLLHFLSQTHFSYEPHYS